MLRLKYLGGGRPTGAERTEESPALRTTGEGEIERHDAVVARLKREHGRKYSFRQLLEEE